MDRCAHPKEGIVYLLELGTLLLNEFCTICPKREWWSEVFFPLLELNHAYSFFSNSFLSYVIDFSLNYLHKLIHHLGLPLAALLESSHVGIFAGIRTRTPSRDLRKARAASLDRRESSQEGHLFRP